MESKAQWLRSEIEKLGGSVKTPQTEGVERETVEGMMYRDGYNTALTTIITRYKEELLELDKTSGL